MVDLAAELSHLSGSKITGVEVVSICHVLRLYLDDKWQVDFPGSWRYRSEKSTILGAMDMDFYMELDDEYLDEEDKIYTKKASSLKGKKISNIYSKSGDLFFEISGGRFLDVFDLSSRGLSILVKDVS